MTTERPEIVLEGTLDATTRVPSTFVAKLGDVGATPPQIAPYPPRLDGQLWFAALGTCAQKTHVAEPGASTIGTRRGPAPCCPPWAK